MHQLPENIDEVIEHLDQIITESIHDKSRDGYFAALYKRVTVAVKQRITEGYFDDNPRMERLDVIFANRYLTAYYGYKQSGTCTESWLLAFETAKHWKPLVIQHLFVGMNAHIGLDLGIAASEVQPDNIESLHSDFNKINEILGSLVNEVQDELAAIFPLLKPIDWIAGSADEKVAKFAMDFARDEAWKVAKEYNVLNTPEERSAYVRKRDASVVGFGRKIVSPGKLVNFLITLFRPLEMGNVRSKIRELNRN